MSQRLLISWCALALAACQAPSGVQTLAPVRAPIVNGTREPQVVTLSAGEKLAIGFLADSYGDEYCTGTVIAPTFVLTATHCIEDVTLEDVIFGVGTQPASPTATYEVVEIREHSSFDASLLVLAEPVTDEVTPLPFNRDTPSSSWVGKWTDAAGYGDTQASSTGRFFAKVIVEGIESEHIHVDGRGAQGICEGDSGGPLLWQPTGGGPVMIVGIEEYGDADSCVANDWEIRTDRLAAWIDAELGNPTPGELQPCSVSTFGAPRCAGEDFVWCQDGRLHSQDCAAEGGHCGKRTATTYGCLPAACAGTDFRGACLGSTARYCTTSGLREEDCTAQGWPCALTTEGYRCGCTACGSGCADLGTSIDHCGACNSRCAPDNATGACEDGVCGVAKCERGFADADGDPLNGCEKEVRTKKGCAATDAAPWVASAGALALIAARRRRHRAA